MPRSRMSFAPDVLGPVKRQKLPQGPEGLPEPQAILFACTSNSIRSVMAEALAKAHFRTRIFIDSVGVRPVEVNPFVVEVMGEVGIDVSDHKPKSFEELEDTSFDLIVTLSPEAQHKAVQLTHDMAADVEFWPALDPTVQQGGSREQQLGLYRELREALKGRIADRFGMSGGKL